MTLPFAIHTCTPHVHLNTYIPMANIGADYAVSLTSFAVS